MVEIDKQGRRDGEGKAETYSARPTEKSGANGSSGSSGSSGNNTSDKVHDILNKRYGSDTRDKVHNILNKK
jgi:hypothetical protein